MKKKQIQEIEIVGRRRVLAKQLRLWTAVEPHFNISYSIF